MAICRVWRGWTTPQNAQAYSRLLLGEVLPSIKARGIVGLRKITSMRRDTISDTDGPEVEFSTLIWFDSLDDVKAFMGEDYTVAHIPDVAKAVLKRWDKHCLHYEVFDA